MVTWDLHWLRRPFERESHWSVVVKMISPEKANFASWSIAVTEDSSLLVSALCRILGVNTSSRSTRTPARLSATTAAPCSMGWYTRAWNVTVRTEESRLLLCHDCDAPPRHVWLFYLPLFDLKHPVALGHSVCTPMFYPCIDPWLLVHCILHVQSWLFCTKILKHLTLQSTRWLSSWWGESAQKGLTPFEIWYLAKWRKLQYFGKTNNDYFGNLMLCLRWFPLWLAPQVGFTQKLHLKFLNSWHCERCCKDQQWTSRIVNGVYAAPQLSAPLLPLQLLRVVVFFF